MVDCLKLQGLTINSSLSFNAHVKSICNKVNVKVAFLRTVHSFIPPEVMVNIYEAFVLTHCSLVLIGLSSGLSNKLQLTQIIPLHYCAIELVSFKEQGISIHMQISGQVFCNLAKSVCY